MSKAKINTPQSQIEALGKLIDDCVTAMYPFFELAEAEFREKSSTDLDNLEFLVKAAKALERDFGDRAFRIYGEGEL